METFTKLLNVACTLLGENGCPWDKKQTLFTLQPYLLEEAHELIEAIDSQDAQKMKEELGDTLYTLIFIAKIAEKEGLFTLYDAMDAITEKLIRRHPHVFGEEKVKDFEEVMRNWEEIKQKEGRKSPFEGIPPTLPSLARAQKIIATQRRRGEISLENIEYADEQQFIDKIWKLVQEAEFAGYDIESALRRRCMSIEKKVPEIDS